MATVLLVLLFPILSPPILAAPSSLTPRKSFDPPQIICPGRSPPIWAFPSTHPKILYPTNAALCMLARSARRVPNVGCDCSISSADYGNVFCHRDRASEILFDWRIAPRLDGVLGETFDEYCRNVCYCATGEELQEKKHKWNSDRIKSLQHQKLVVWRGIAHRSWSGGGEEYRDADWWPAGSTLAMSFSKESDSSKLGQCSGSCDGSRDCGVGGDCMCGARRVEDAGSKSNGFLFDAACISRAALLGRDMIACACNKTYVSMGCCGTGTDGIVHEKGAYLGSLN